MIMIIKMIMIIVIIKMIIEVKDEREEENNNINSTTSYKDRNYDILFQEGRNPTNISPDLEGP